MVERAKISKSRYFIAFLIATGIFLLGLFLGLILTQSKFSQINNAQLELRTQLLSVDLENLLVQGNICKLNDVDYLIQDLSTIGNNLNSMESSLGKDNSDVVSLKSYYSLLEIRHMLYIQDYNKKCNNKFKVVLFFYSNDEKVCPDCESQGYILSYFKAKDPSIEIYSYDVNINNSAIKTLMRIYRVKEAPSLVINGKVYTGYKDKLFLQDLLKD